MRQSIACLCRVAIAGLTSVCLSGSAGPSENQIKYRHRAKDQKESDRPLIRINKIVDSFVADECGQGPPIRPSHVLGHEIWKSQCVLLASTWDTGESQHTDKLRDILPSPQPDAAKWNLVGPAIMARN